MHMTIKKTCPGLSDVVIDSCKNCLEIKDAYDNHKICPGLSDIVIDSCKNCLEIKVYVVTQMEKSPSYCVYIEKVL